MREPARGSASASAAATASEVLLPLVVILALLVHAGGASVCDKAICGKGSCSETPLLPNYVCNCDPGWSNAVKLVPSTPCIVPNCSFNSACLNLTPPTPPPPPTGIPDVCSVVSCGAGGVCKTGGSTLSYSCECRPGYSNLLNLTALPCVNCFLGSECYALGLGPPEPPPPPPPPAPSGDHGQSPPSSAPPPPSGTKGAVSSPAGLLQLLLMMLVSVAMLQVV